jgi:rhamnogalacturonan endolyase
MQKTFFSRTCTHSVAVVAFATLLIASAWGEGGQPARIMERLGRGVVAVRSKDDAKAALVSWRLLGLDPAAIAFNLYRSTDKGPWVKLNSAPISVTTDYLDKTADFAKANSYRVCAVVDGAEQEPSGAYTLPANTPGDHPYFSIPIIHRKGMMARHGWVGDLDGDGEYEFVISRVAADANSHETPKLEAYTRGGKRLWVVEMGPSAAAMLSNGHNDHATVYDLDCDGKAEVIVKTAKGTTFGDGKVVEYGDDVTGFVSVLDGMTGAERARATITRKYLANGPLEGHFGIVYLDGVHPSILFECENRIGKARKWNRVVTTWNFKDNKLAEVWRWEPDPKNYPSFYHQIRCVDVDSDGRDEMAAGGFVLDDNGRLLYRLQGVVHGDRFHIGDLDPDRPGLEGFGIQQTNPSWLAFYYYDAKTGEILRRHMGSPKRDWGRGTTADIDPNARGYEYWSTGLGIFNAPSGRMVGPELPTIPVNLRIWWDGDLLGELLDGVKVVKWNPAVKKPGSIFDVRGYGAVSTWRHVPVLYGDIIGDWREEIVYENADRSELQVYTTWLPAERRIYTLVHDPAYRLGLTVKGYVQSLMTDYYLGAGMSTPPVPNIRYAK